jgi:hypothetical protein
LGVHHTKEKCARIRFATRIRVLLTSHRCNWISCFVPHSAVTYSITAPGHTVGLHGHGLQFRLGVDKAAVDAFATAFPDEAATATDLVESAP